MHSQKNEKQGQSPIEGLRLKTQTASSKIATLAKLYDPDKMPDDLKAAHAALDAAVDAESGYANGSTVEPSYEDVCRGDTGHAEAVRVTYDPNVISLTALVEQLFAIIDATASTARRCASCPASG